MLTTIIISVSVLIALLVVVFLICALVKRLKEVEEKGILTVGEVRGSRFDDNFFTYEVWFTDQSGKERKGYSQTYSGKGITYKVGDRVPIKYLIKTSLGIETVEVRIQDK